jgi:hypothetical protein
MAGTATVTAKYGPALTATATALTNVTAFSVDTENELLTVSYSTTNQKQSATYDIAAVTTITCTVSGKTYTLTMS